jgi:hypothetical protein
MYIDLAEQTTEGHRRMWVRGPRSITGCRTPYGIEAVVPIYRLRSRARTANSSNTLHRACDALLVSSLMLLSPTNVSQQSVEGGAALC